MFILELETHSPDENRVETFQSDYANLKNIESELEIALSQVCFFLAIPPYTPFLFCVYVFVPHLCELGLLPVLHCSPQLHCVRFSALKTFLVAQIFMDQVWEGY